DTAQAYTFTPSAPLTLVGGETYWLLGDTATNLSTGPDTRWLANVASLTPMGLATFGGYRLSSDDGASYAGSSTLNSFQINGTEVVPEPSTWVLMLIGLGALVVVGYRRQRFATA